MKCFYYFKDKSRGREQRSAPELEERGKSDYSNRATKSSCSASSPRGIPQLYEERAHNLRVFSYLELQQATHDFSRLLKIGEGGFGSVYKGSIKLAEGKGDPIVVAIKKLNKDGLQVRMSVSVKQYEESYSFNSFNNTVGFMLIVNAQMLDRRILNY